VYFVLVTTKLRSKKSWKHRSRSRLIGVKGIRGIEISIDSGLSACHSLENVASNRSWRSLSLFIRSWLCYR